VLYICILLMCIIVYVHVCILLFSLSDFFFVAFSFSTLILLVGSFDLYKSSAI